MHGGAARLERQAAQEVAEAAAGDGDARGARRRGEARLERLGGGGVRPRVGEEQEERAHHTRGTRALGYFFCDGGASFCGGSSLGVAAVVSMTSPRSTSGRSPSRTRRHSACGSAEHTSHRAFELAHEPRARRGAEHIDETDRERDRGVRLVVGALQRSLAILVGGAASFDQSTNMSYNFAVAIGTPAAISCFVSMRAAAAIAGFLLVTLGLGGSARAHVPLWAPRVSLSLALDWNKLAVEAIRRPKDKAPARARRHVIPALTVTAAAPPVAQLDVAAYGRIEGWARDIVIPHYVQPDVDHRQMFLRQFDLAPCTPYLGAYGFVLTVETDAVLR